MTVLILRNSNCLFKLKNVANIKYPDLLFFKQLSTTDYCVDSVKKFDYENFVCTLLLKNSARTNGIAIRAFNVEISRVQDQITDSKIGLMRMKFWEDALDNCFSNSNKIPNHPVVIELHRVLKSNKFTKRYFQSLIKSRQDILLNNTFATLESMEKYAEQSVSSIYYLILEGSNIRNVQADHAASHLGKAQGLVQLLRSIPITSAANFIALPQDLLTEFKISHEDVIRGKNSDNIKECVFKVATRANQHLEKARNLSKDLTNEAKQVLLPATIVEMYLQRLLKADCDIFHKSMQIRNLSWIPVIWWRNLRKTY